MKKTKPKTTTKTPKDVTPNPRPSPDFEVTYAQMTDAWGMWRKRIRGKIEGNDGGFQITWGTKSAGFGTATFRIKKGKVHCDNEMMSREFIKDVLCKMVDLAIMDCDDLPR